MSGRRGKILEKRGGKGAAVLERESARGWVGLDLIWLDGRMEEQMGFIVGWNEWFCGFGDESSFGLPHVLAVKGWRDLM